MVKKGIMVLVVLIAVILCGPVSAMYQYNPEAYNQNIYAPDRPTMVTSEDWNSMLEGGSSDHLHYLEQLPSRPQENVIQESSDSTSSDSSQATSTESSATPESSTSQESSTGTAINNTPNTNTESGTQAAVDSGKAYESAKAGTSDSNETPWGAYAVGGIISIMAIGAIGLYYRGNLF